MGCAIGALSRSDNYTDGPDGAGVWHERIKLVAGRITTGVETKRCVAGDIRTSRQFVVAPLARREVKFCRRSKPRYHR